jgi:hypothetical protein
MSGSQQRWVPPIRNGILIMRQQQQQQQEREQPLDETPIIKDIVEQIKNCSSSILDIPDIATKIAKLKKYTFIRPLGNAIREYFELTSSATASLESDNDIYMIELLYKDIDWIVWTYEFYVNQVSKGMDPSADPTTPPILQSLSLLSYPEFVNHIFHSYIVPTIRYMNGMNQSHVQQGTNHTSEGTSPIIDLLLCGTDIPIPASIYDLPKALYYALQETKYSPSTNDDTDSSASTNVSLVYMNRNHKLRNNNVSSNKSYHEVENMRYNVLYLYLLAHVSIYITNVHNIPSDNKNHDASTLFSHTPSPSLLRWKHTLTKVIQSHPLPSAQSMMYLAPVVMSMVQLEWYCHPTLPITNEPTILTRNEEAFSAYSRCPLGIPLKLIVSELLKDQ